MNVGVIGLGKLGLPLAALLANSGHDVIGLDKSLELIEKLKSKKYQVAEPGLDDLLNSKSIKIEYTTEMSELSKHAEVIFIIVPTPSKETGHFSNQYLIDALEEIGENVNSNNKLVIDIVSTVMPGSCEDVLIPAFEKSAKLKIGSQIGFCYNPEFIALGSVIENMQYPDMHLLGESESWAGDIVEACLKSIVQKDVPAMRMSLKEAELVKISVNNFVTMKISYANSLYQVAEKIGGINIDTVTNAIGLDSRIGRKYLKGAAPYGGPCFPRDTRALDALFHDFGILNTLSTATDLTNKSHIKFLASQVMQQARGGKTIGIAGISYKIGTPVTEESPGLAIAKELISAGYEIAVWDDENAKPEGISSASLELNEFLAKSDFILISRPISDQRLFSELINRKLPYLDLWRQK